MHVFKFFLAVLNSSYFVEWIPNNAALPGEFPWQGGS